MASENLIELGSVHQCFKICYLSNKATTAVRWCSWLSRQSNIHLLGPLKVSSSSLGRIILGVLLVLGLGFLFAFVDDGRGT